MLNFYSEEDRVGCFVIGYYGIRMEIESRNREYWEALNRSLSGTIADDMQMLKSFVSKATVILKRDLQSIQDITNSSIAKEQITKKMEMVRK